MENKQYTVPEALELTANRLEGIMVPAALTQQIGIPIFESVQNIRQCIAVITVQPPALEIAEADAPPEGADVFEIEQGPEE